MSDRDSQQTVERRRREGAVKVDRLQVFTVDCDFGIRLNGFKSKPIERTASQLSNDMKIG